MSQKENRDEMERKLDEKEKAIEVATRELKALDDKLNQKRNECRRVAERLDEILSKIRQQSTVKDSSSTPQNQEVAVDYSLQEKAWLQTEFEKRNKELDLLLEAWHRNSEELRQLKEARDSSRGFLP
jgi:chromosome segregation ATPase